MFIFVFYFVPDAKQKLGLFPEETFQDAIRKYGIADDDDMKNLIDNLQTDVSEITLFFELNNLDMRTNTYDNTTTGTSNQALTF